jgi:hypothetical protein
MIDHLVYASTDLRSASDAVAGLVGVVPAPGGRHIDRGTHNELLSLGGSTYLEIIGPDPEQPAPDGPRPFGIDDLVMPALVAWCVRPRRPLEHVLADAHAAGFDFGSLAQMSRRRPDGVLLEWQLTFPQLAGPFGCALPFLIDWGGSAHPTESLPPAVQLVGFEVQHPHTERLRAALDIIGVTTDCDLRTGPHPALIARLRTPRGEVSLTS